MGTSSSGHFAAGDLGFGISGPSWALPQFRRLFDVLPAGAYTCDPAGLITYYNSHAVKMWGREPRLNHPEDRFCGSFKLYSSDGAPIRHDQCWMAMALHTNTEYNGREIIVQRPGGELLTVLAYANPIRDEQGSLVGAINVLVDISDRKAAEAALSDAKDAAEAANKAKDRFLAVLSHELRTPLTPVLMSAAAMENNPDLPQSVQESAAMIRRNVELETALIDDLLDLNRITTGKLRLNLQSVDLNEAVRDVCDICHGQIREKGIRLLCDLDPQIRPLSADPARLRQVLWNVLKNAAKFTPDNGNIDVSTQAHAADGRFAVVRVRDNGIGIVREFLPKLFEAFEQGEPDITREFGGLGLGLAISKALVGLHGGSIRAESDGSGTGATFIIELPLAASPIAPAPSEPEQPHSHRAIPLTVLLVEDHVDTVEMLGRLLRAAGYSVSTANDVAGALKLASAQTFDVIVSDLGLPDASGYSLIRRLREQVGAVRAIAMSGYGMDEDIRKSREAGFLEHLVKPVNAAALKAAIRRATASIHHTPLA